MGTPVGQAKLQILCGQVKLEIQCGRHCLRFLFHPCFHMVLTLSLKNSAISENALLQRYDVTEQKLMIQSWKWKRFQAVHSVGDWQMFLCFPWKFQVSVTPMWAPCGGSGYLSHSGPRVITLIPSSKRWEHFLSWENSNMSSTQTPEFPCDVKLHPLWEDNFPSISFTVECLSQLSLPGNPNPGSHY